MPAYERIVSAFADEELSFRSLWSAQPQTDAEAGRFADAVLADAIQ